MGAREREEGRRREGGEKLGERCESEIVLSISIGWATGC